MPDTVIKIENLYKEYRLGVIGHGTLYRDLQSWWAKLRGKEDPNSLIGSYNHGINKSDNNNILALKDINLEVKEGEVLGIIGKNGAGKSTLLKILSRVTTPTRGIAKVKGRIASLLEVGTGFHPELTGKENIFLNSAINGMTKSETSKKFDEIVDFAGIEKFLDTPVKRYSSGMYVRLAFAVAAHLNPEVLLVDEVLAVGDSDFQKKCLGKMGNVAREGRTILFVSHNMGAMQKICERVVLLDKGTVVEDGTPRTIIDKYLTMGLVQNGERIWSNIDQAPGNDVARLRAVRVLDQHGGICTNFDVRDPISIEMEYCLLQHIDQLEVSFYLYNEKGTLLLMSVEERDSPWRNKVRPPGFYRSTCHILPDFLNNGQIYVMAALTDMKSTIFTIQYDVVMFNVGDSMDKEGVRGNYPSEWPPAAVRPKFHWSTKYYPLTQAQKQIEKKT